MKTIERSTIATLPTIAMMGFFTAPAAAVPEQQPSSPAPEQPVSPEIPQDKWEALAFLVSRGRLAIELESKIALVFEKRAGYMRRLSDGLKRKDDAMVSPTVEKWLKSEVELADLLVDYSPVQLERERILAHLKA